MTAEKGETTSVSQSSNVSWPLGLLLAFACLGVWAALSPDLDSPALLAGVFVALAVVALWVVWRQVRRDRQLRRSLAAWRDRADSAESKLRANNGGSLDIAGDLEASEIRFLKVFRYNPIAMALVRPDLGIAYTNQQFRQLSGAGESELVGQPVCRVVDETDQDTLRAIVQRTLDDAPGEGPQEEWREFRFIGRDGDSRWTRVSTESIQDAGGRVIYALLMAEDISERKRFDADRAAYQERLESLSRRLLEAQEEERRHIARELHDELGQNMTAIKLGLQALRARSGQLAGQVDEISGRVDELIDQVRRLSRELRPSVLDDLGLEAALRWLINQYWRDSDIHVHLSIDKLEERPPHWVESACFRVVQEALTNVMRHSGASAVSVQVIRQDDMLRFSVDDDGRGFEPGLAWKGLSAGKSLGLVSMEERVTLLGGRFRIQSEAGLGTRVSARIPLVWNNPRGAVQSGFRLHSEGLEVHS